MVKLTPILLVEEIEPCIIFWVDKLGYELKLAVPDRDGGGLAFAKLKKGNVELMYQSRASLSRDLPLLAEQSFHSATVLNIEVEDVDEIIRQLSEYEVLVPIRRSTHGAHEIFVREPGGSVVAFTQNLKLADTLS